MNSYDRQTKKIMRDLDAFVDAQVELVVNPPERHSATISPLSAAASASGKPASTIDLKALAEEAISPAFSSPH